MSKEQDLSKYGPLADPIRTITSKKVPFALANEYSPNDLTEEGVEVGGPIYDKGSNSPLNVIFRRLHEGGSEGETRIEYLGVTTFREINEITGN